jgi:hypothetical protein
LPIKLKGPEMNELVLADKAAEWAPAEGAGAVENQRNE